MTVAGLEPDPPEFDYEGPLVPTGNLRRRLIVNRLATSGATAAALLAVGVLGVVIYSVAHKGASQLSFGFLTKDPPRFPGPGGGIAPAIVGSAIIVAVATAMAAPIGVLIALYMTEFAPRSRSARFMRLVLDLLNGVPAIVVGVFVFGLMVVGHGQSGLAGSIALAIIMLPLISRTSQEVLLLVPGTMREAAEALGVSRWRTVLGVILPSALGGILTGTLLAVARAAGESAPLILVSSQLAPGVQLNPLPGHGLGLDSIPLSIFTASEQADPASFARAWGAAFVLLMFILVTSLSARALLNRNRRKLTG
ncbi:MAG: phosphate transport system permease protein [Solirubrobacteraceae bacterium]|jgi:phosphate transport system permease protein|nr:phosphate transport system permease protein [Solirubrobacteraceae bacterium]